MDSIKSAPLRIYDIRSKYKVIDKVGRGTYGTVFKVLSLEDNKFYAIKKFENTQAKLQVEGFPITALREISLLKQLNHPNIINLKQIICSRPNKRNLFRGSTFLVFEYMHHDFSGLFKSKIKFTQPQIKSMMKQILEGCNFLHQNKVMHRDIKSANILLNDNGVVQLADFGLGRRTRFENVFTYKVVTLWYRAPELLLGNKSYNHKIDVWSIGCVFAQFLIGDVLFKRQTQYAIIEKIYEVCGGLEQNDYTEDYLRGCAYYHDMKPKKPYENNLIKYIKKLNPDVDSLSLQFLKGLLELNPYKRLSCEEALAHEYFFTQPLPCEPEEIQKLDVQYHEMFRDRSLKIERQKKKQSVDWTDEQQERKKKKMGETENKDQQVYRKNSNYLAENNRQPPRYQRSFERKSYNYENTYESHNRKDYRGQNDRKDYHRQTERRNYNYPHRQSEKKDYREPYLRKDDDKYRRKKSYSLSKSRSKSYSSSSSSSSSSQHSRNKYKRPYDPIQQDRKPKINKIYNERQREYVGEKDRKYDRDVRPSGNYQREPHSMISKYHHTNTINRWNEKSQRYDSERKNQRESSRNYRQNTHSREYRDKYQGSSKYVRQEHSDRYPRHQRDQRDYPSHQKPYRQRQDNRKPYYQGRQQRQRNFDENRRNYKSQKFQIIDQKVRRDPYVPTDYAQNRNSTDYGQNRSNYKGRQYVSESFKNQYQSYTKNYEQRSYNNSRPRQGNYYEQPNKKDYLIGREDYKKISVQKRQSPSKKHLDFQQY